MSLGLRARQSSGVESKKRTTNSHRFREARVVDKARDFEPLHEEANPRPRGRPSFAKNCNFHSHPRKSAGLGEPSKQDANYPEKPIRPCAFATGPSGAMPEQRLLCFCRFLLTAANWGCFFIQLQFPDFQSPPDTGLNVFAKRAVQLSWFPAHGARIHVLRDHESCGRAQVFPCP
jgi:hypothetical protein